MAINPRPPLLCRLPGWLLVGIDVALAGLAALGSVATGEPLPGLVGVLVTLASTLPLAVRRVWPVPVFAALLAGSVAAALVLHIVPYSGIPLALAGYSAALAVPRRRALSAVLCTTTVAASGALAVGVLVPELGSAGRLAFSTGAVVLAGLLLGELVAQQRRHAAALRDQAMGNAVTQERLRIAREMHDVVAHQMSTIAVQAGVARLVMRSRPEDAFGALASIEQASRAGLGELRRLLSALRTGDVPAGVTNGQVDTMLAPAPGLAGLATLTSRAQAAGVAVTVEVRGTASELPPGMELSAYRVIQEALTNVVRHAGAARANVTLHYRPDGLDIEVIDDGRGGQAGPAGTGYGLIGMRERVLLYGGTLSAGPLDPPGTGFRVSATLPRTDGGR